MSSQDTDRDASPPKRPPVGGINIMPGLGAALKGRKFGGEAPAGVGIDRDGGLKSKDSGMIRKDSEKERVKSTSMSNLLASDLSAAGDTSSAPAEQAQRRSTHEAYGTTDSHVLDVVRATHQYKAEFEDELGFEAGDIIEVTEKQSEDEGWWHGRIRGTSKVGLFPDNFVVSIRDSSPPTEPPAVATDSVGVTVTDGNAFRKPKDKEKEREKEKAVPVPRPAPTVHPKPSRPPPPVHPKPPASVAAPAPVPAPAPQSQSSIPPSASNSSVSTATAARESRQSETPSLDDVSAGVVPLQHFKKPGGPQGRRLPSNHPTPPANSNTALPAANNLLEVALRAQQPQAASASGSDADGSKQLSLQEKRQSFPARGVGVSVFPPAPSGSGSGDAAAAGGAGRKSTGAPAPNLNLMSSSMYAPANSNGGPVLTAPQEHIKLHSNTGLLSHAPPGATSHAAAAAVSGVPAAGEYVPRDEYERDMNSLRAEMAALRSELESLKRSLK